MLLIQAHPSLDLDILEIDAAFFAICKQTDLAHGAERTSRKVNADIAAELSDINPFRLNVRKLNFLGFVVCVRDVVTNERRFAGEYTSAGHFEAPNL